MATVTACARGGALPAPPRDAALQVKAGVFVSLHHRGELRGCIGHIEADQPLAALAGRMACAAACDDPRFPPLAADELDGLEVEVSVLEAPVAGSAKDFVTGRHGVIVTLGHARGLLLPQVATEMGWGAEQMLEGASRKAGLPRDAWRRPDAVIELFAVQIIGAAVPT